MNLFCGPVWLRLLIVAWLGCCKPEVGVAGETITNIDPAFELILPDGFVEAPELLKAQPNLLHTFRLGDPEDEEADICLAIEKMSGTIEQVLMREDDLPHDFKGYLFRPKWQGLEVNGVAVPEVHDGVEAIAYNVQIPLRPTAIQVKLVGLKERAAELSQLLDEVLANLAGESNWQDVSTSFCGTTGSLETLTSRAQSEQYGKILLGVGIGLYFVGVIGLWLISRTGHRGLVLGVGVALFLLGGSIGKQKEITRELMMFGGVCSILGLTGGILGIVDLARKQKKKKGPSEAQAATANHPQYGVVDAEVIPSTAVDAEVVDDNPRT